MAVMSRGWRIIMVVILITAAVLRLAASRGDLWLDEIWSVCLAAAVTNPLQIFTMIPSSNNHHLYTIWLWIMRECDTAWLLRLPSVIAGIGTVYLLGSIARRFTADESHGKRAAFVVMFASAVSYLLTFYGSEARGYSSAIFFSLLALAAVQRGSMRAMDCRAILFWIGVIAAMLSQLTSLYPLIGIGAWSTLRLFRQNERGRAIFSAAAWWYSVPAAILVLFYVQCLRNFKIEGAPPWTTSEVYQHLLNFHFGLPREGPLWIGVAVLIGATLPGLWALRERGSDRWVLYAVGILSAPVALTTFWTQSVLFERYFLGGIVLWLLLAAEGAAMLWSKGNLGRVLTAALLITFAAGQIRCLTPFLKYGRGQFRDALALAVKTTPGEKVTITASLPPNGLVVMFHAERDPALIRMSYIRGQEIPPEGPQWKIFSTNSDDEVFPEGIFDPGLNPYRLMGVFRSGSAGLAGGHWGMYINEKTGFGPRR